ncbi:hypothetical protein TNCV_708161 [Trichonephila clavipes]|nr:hypothetical protein TNCV_708161 [Trichonephila clavipes]
MVKASRQYTWNGYGVPISPAGKLHLQSLEPWVSSAPGNNTRIVIQARNGPNIDETTSWLLFLRLTREEIGTYTCRAENAVGSAISSATVQVIELS